MAVFISKAGYRLETNDDAMIEMYRVSGYEEIAAESDKTEKKPARKKKEA